MARASTAVPGRVLSVASTPSALLRQRCFHRLPSGLSYIYTSATGHSQKSRKAHLSSFQTASSHCGRQETCLRLFSFWPSSFRLSSSSTNTRTPSVISNQARYFASQSQKTDGLGRSETFKEYRIQQEVEQRRRAIRELEDDLLRSQVEVADARLHLNLQELVSLPV